MAELLPDSDDLLDMDGLAEMLKMSKASTYKLVAANRIPGRKVGKHWRFLRSEIDAWLRAGVTQPRDEPRHLPAKAPAGRLAAWAAEKPMAVATAMAERAAWPAAEAPFQGVFTPAQAALLKERWIETPKQFLAVVERAEARRGMASLLSISEDELQVKIISVASLAAVHDRPGER